MLLRLHMLYMRASIMLVTSNKGLLAMIRNLGQLLSVLLVADRQISLIWQEAQDQGVPPECHNAVNATANRIRNGAIRRIEQLSGHTWQTIRAQTILRTNMNPDNMCDRWRRLVA